MWTPEKSKLELATELLGEIMPMLKDKQVILCFDSWYAKWVDYKLMWLLKQEYTIRDVQSVEWVYASL